MRPASSLRAALVLSLSLVVASTTLAQPAAAPSAGSAHAVPFASEGNTLALTVANGSAEAAESVRVALAETPPAWLSFEQEALTLRRVEAGGEAVARFRFSVGEQAPAGRTEALHFAVTGTGGRGLGEKTIRVEVAAPAEFALSGNYPNPFRQTTRIGYQLPEPAEVTINVYDALGRQVRRLEEGRREAGGHAARLEAGRLASGVYFYRIQAGEQVETGRMVVVR